LGGFGRSPFGRGPFGKSDLGTDLIIDLFPLEYFDDTLQLSPGETIRDNDKDPLLKFLKVYAHGVNKRRDVVDEMLKLVDYEAAPLDIVRLWGEMLGLGIDKNDPDFLQRSFLGNASQWLQIKATKQGYEVRGLASGFDVIVENFWRYDTALYDPSIPPRNRYELKPKNADLTAQKIWHTDLAPTPENAITYSGLPSVESATYAKSSYIHLVFSVAEPRRDFVDYNTLLDLVIDKINDVVGIHHEILPPEFRIYMDVAVTVTSDSLSHELANLVGPMVNFDDIPADYRNLDMIGLNPLVTVEMFPFTESFVAVVVEVESVESLSQGETFVADIAGAPALQIVVEEGWSVLIDDPFPNFDLTPADTRILDADGYVTVSVSSGP
jgi:hypothetical protein